MPRISSAATRATCAATFDVGPATISTSGITRGGLKKWVMTKLLAKASLRPSTKWASGIVDVFDETMEPGLRAASIFPNNSR